MIGGALIRVQQLDVYVILLHNLPPLKAITNLRILYMCMKNEYVYFVNIHNSQLASQLVHFW